MNNKKGNKTDRKRLFVVSILVVSVIAGVFLVYFLSQNSSTKPPNVAYTNLLIRANTMTKSLTFGDTDYLLSYNAFQETIANISTIWVRAPLSNVFPLNSELIDQPKNGTSYTKIGIEIVVEDIGSDDISLFIKLKVRPIVENYMFLTYNYTRIDIPFNDSTTVNITSLSSDKTNQYAFKYAFVPPYREIDATLVVESMLQSKQYNFYFGEKLTDSRDGFKIEIRVYWVDLEHMILFVKPLY
jgi:hypothetical protein